MDEHQAIRQGLVALVAHPARQTCLVTGCPCRDARIVSRRRAAFFAALARQHGETANRSIAPEPDWHLPAFAA
jgi:hypothetical protein